MPQREKCPLPKWLPAHADRGASSIVNSPSHADAASQLWELRLQLDSALPPHGYSPAAPGSASPLPCIIGDALNHAHGVCPIHALDHQSPGSGSHLQSYASTVARARTQRRGHCPGAVLSLIPRLPTRVVQRTVPWCSCWLGIKTMRW